MKEIAEIQKMAKIQKKYQKKHLKSSKNVQKFEMTRILWMAKTLEFQKKPESFKFSIF